MTIKQNGGVFGRNPTFNDVTIEGQLTFDGDIDINSDLKVDGDLDVTGGMTVDTDTLVVDAVNDRVGIGTSSPNIYSTSGASTGVVGIQGGTGALLALNATGTGFSGIDLGGAGIRRGGMYTLNGSHLVFYTNQTNSGTSLTEAVRINSGGYVIAPYGVTLGTAAGNYNADNTLDDYEEGAWTPVIADAESGGNEASATSSFGEYTKVGNIVTIVFEVLNIDTTGLTSGNQVFVTGLPFIAAASSGSLNYTGIVQGGGTLTSATTLTASIQDNKQQLRFQNPEAIGLSTWLTVAEINSGTTDLRCSLTYRST